VIADVDGHDADAVDAAIADAKRATDRPTLIVCKTMIGKGSPNRAGTAKAHGEALGADEVRLTREALVWAHEPFVLPEDAYTAWDAKARGEEAESAWQADVRALQGGPSRACRRIRPADARRAAGRIGPRPRSTQRSRRMRRPRPSRAGRRASSRSRRSRRHCPSCSAAVPT
jgi:transketolase